MLLFLLITLLGGCTNQKETMEQKQHPVKLSVSVKDLTPPVIYCSKDSITVNLGTVFLLDDIITVKDNVDGPIGYECQGSFDINKAGQYILLIKAVDHAGNSSSKNITISVIDPTPIAPPVDQPKQQPSSTPNETSEPEKSPTPSVDSSIISRDYLYSDGYTMESASSACSNDLHSSGRSGSCDPITDEHGIYLGMHLTLY